MRELAREWIASFTSFTRGHGGGEKANASVGAAFVIGAIVVAVLGLRWISAAGPTEEAADDTPWDFAGSGDGETTGTTIPASLPARVVVVRDPGDPPPGETIVTLPEGQTGIFLPGFPPIPGGTTGTTGPGNDGTNPPGSNPGTTRPGSGPTTSQRPPTTWGPGPTTTAPPPTTSEPPPTTQDTTPTTEPPPTTEDTTPPTGDGLEGLGAGVGQAVADAIDGLGLLIS